MFNYNNPYYTPPQAYRPPMNTPQPQQLYTPQPIQGLQGKSVDSLEVIKAMDIPLDGSMSYFPLIDGSAIVTKQLQQDGTSKITIYKPIEAEETTTAKYVTVEELENKIKDIKYLTIEDLESKLKDIKIPDTKGLQDDIKSLKKQIRILLDKED
ncbi:MAG: hypothetical protein K2P14_05220 [Anaeroplasmataceae bacterium]|nr:hypothetical protein [Anaeroplasmataceae bacterium]